MIGSVEFAKPGLTEMQQDINAGVLSNPALSSVLGSERGKALLASQVSSQYLPCAKKLLLHVPQDVCHAILQQTSYALSQLLCIE